MNKSRAKERARRKALGIGTRITRHGSLERDPVLPLEDVSVGDVVQFVGSNANLSRLPGFRMGTVMKVHPVKRTLRVESRITVPGGERTFFKAEVHETRLVENYGPRTREVS